MKDSEIIDYWKQGYSIDQITNKSKIVQRCKNKNVTKMEKIRVEYVILKYQSRR